MPRTTLICTVGTSLFFPNLAGLRRNPAPATAALADAYDAKDWPAVARLLAAFPPTDRLCGAEVNSVAGLVANGSVAATAGVVLVHSDTDDGRAIAGVLAAYFAAHGHSPVEAVPVPDLQDADPQAFRAKGLPNLARLLAAKVKECGAAACGINATGGYKAVAAIAAVVGNALGVPVYYLHERFSEVVELPPFSANGPA